MHGIVQHEEVHFGFNGISRTPRFERILAVEDFEAAAVGKVVVTHEIYHCATTLMNNYNHTTELMI